MPPVSAVLLDAGGVFLLPSPEIMLPPLRAAGVHPGVPDLERAHYKATAAVESVPEPERWPGYLRGYAIACGIPADDAAAAADGLARATGGSTWRHIIPGCTEGLSEIAALGVPLGIVSNSTGTVEGELAELGICQTGPGEGTEVGTVIDSAVVGVEKPDPRIFGLALQQLGINRDGVLHIGDTIRFDVDGARAAGIRPVHLDPYHDCPAPRAHEHIRRLADLPAIIRPWLGGLRRLWVARGSGLPVNGDPSCIGCEGELIVGTRGDAGPGEVLVRIRGGRETFLAWSDSPLPKGTTVLVIDSRGARTVDVMEWTDPLGAAGEDGG